MFAPHFTVAHKVLRMSWSGPSLHHVLAHHHHHKTETQPTQVHIRAFFLTFFLLHGAMAGGWAIFWRQFSVRTYLLPVVQRTGGLGGGGAQVWMEKCHPFVCTTCKALRMCFFKQVTRRKSIWLSACSRLLDLVACWELGGDGTPALLCADLA